MILSSGELLPGGMYHVRYGEGSTEYLISLGMCPVILNGSLQGVTVLACKKGEPHSLVGTLNVSAMLSMDLVEVRDLPLYVGWVYVSSWVTKLIRGVYEKT